jgi:hypothetical protein
MSYNSAFTDDGDDFTDDFKRELTEPALLSQPSDTFESQPSESRASTANALSVLPNEMFDTIFIRLRPDAMHGGAELYILALNQKMNASAELALYRHVNIQSYKTISTAVSKLVRNSKLRNAIGTLQLKTSEDWSTLWKLDSRIPSSPRDLWTAALLIRAPNVKYLNMKVARNSK